MLWHAMPPEANAAMLIAGAGPAPMLEAAAAWGALSSDLETEAASFAGVLASLQAAWRGSSSEQAMAASLPMVAWLQNAAQYAQQCALKAAAQAEAYVKAVAMTPSLPEIAANHVTHAVLSATNFFGINMVPIGFTETDYFVRMWNQAGSAMDIYQAETVVNTAFGPLESPQPIVKSAAGQAAATQLIQSLASQPAAAQVAGMAALADATANSAAGDSTAAGDSSAASDSSAAGDSSASGLADSLQAQVNGAVAAATGQGAAADTQALTQMAPMAASAPSMMSQMFSQAGSMGGAGGMGGAGSGAGVGDTASPAGSDGAGADGNGMDQMGLLGASPMSTHPMTGGSGPSVGKGLMYSEALPGAGGSVARTSAMAELIDKPAQGAASASAGAGASATGGAAPMGMMGAGAGAGGPSAASANAEQREMASAVLTQSDDDAMFDDGDEW